ncbi:asparagine synthase-related protein [Halorubrum salinum]|uniref:asparagine synthase-related protein n=1 Tax=Halorubrum salinum TaxID=767517 RepID=UPI002112DE32|nr:asparagine synthase-related protein [Halorubrum salinum]
MPGVTVVAGSNMPDTTTIIEAHEPSLYDDRYDIDISVNDSFYFVSATYPSYPITTYEFQDNPVTVILEGKIYNRTRQTLAEEIEQHLVTNLSFESITKWLSSLDGEFIFYLHDHQADQLTIIPDLLGQLPLFYVTNKSNYALIGRNKSVLSRFLPDVKFDQLAMAQYLRLGYALTDRTLFADIRRVPDSTIVQVNTQSGELNLRRHHQFDFSTESHKSRSIRKNASELADRFAEATRRRADACPGRNILLLSGGMDSRGVLGALDRTDTEYTTVTRDYKHDSSADIEVAEELADAVSAEWTRISTPAPTGRDLLTHLDMTAGTDPFNIAHIQSFLGQIVEKNSKTVWGYTGDGGDKILPDISPAIQIKSTDDLIDYILESESNFDQYKVEKITNVTEDEIRSSINDRLESYPEASLNKQFIHYEMFERGFAWLFEATDTNRNYMWTTSPYYAPEVLSYAMKCPDSQKHRFKLFTVFLNELAPELTKIVNANVGVPPASRSHTLRYALHDNLKRHPKILAYVLPYAKKIIGTRTNATTSQTLIECINDQIAGSSTVIDFDSIEEVFLNRIYEYPRNHVFLLLTLLTLLDRETDAVLYDNYRDSEFE